MSCMMDGFDAYSFPGQLLVLRPRWGDAKLWAMQIPWHSFPRSYCRSPCSSVGHDVKPLSKSVGQDMHLYIHIHIDIYIIHLYIIYTYSYEAEWNKMIETKPNMWVQLDSSQKNIYTCEQVRTGRKTGRKEVPTQIKAAKTQLHVGSTQETNCSLPHCHLP